MFSAYLFLLTYIHICLPGMIALPIDAKVASSAFHDAHFLYLVHPIHHHILMIF